MVVIIDYGCGNIASVFNMVRRAGYAAMISCQPEVIIGASALILPGVGSFDHGVRQMRDRGLPEMIKERVAAGVPLLGICLGMQLLALDSEEGELKGLGLVRAHVKRFSFPASSSIPVPHVGWNKVQVRKPNLLIPSDGQVQRFYFVHSYYVECESIDDILCETNYGGLFTSGFSCGKVYGVQFHPEKSHRFGLDLISRFLEVSSA